MQFPFRIHQLFVESGTAVESAGETGVGFVVVAEGGKVMKTVSCAVSSSTGSLNGVAVESVAISSDSSESGLVIVESGSVWAAVSLWRILYNTAKTANSTTKTTARMTGQLIELRGDSSSESGEYTLAGSGVTTGATNVCRGETGAWRFPERLACNNSTFA